MMLLILVVEEKENAKVLTMIGRCFDTNDDVNDRRNFILIIHQTNLFHDKNTGTFLIPVLFVYMCVCV